MRVVVSGSHGLIASHLLPALRRAGHTPIPLVRGEAGPGQVSWDPGSGSIDLDRLAGVDAAVHLAGAGLLRRWTPSGRELILRSRTEGTALLARSLAAVDPLPRVLVSASAIGWYGDRGDEVLTEDSEPGDGFLADVCRQWEAATGPASDAGIRTVLARTGIVQSTKGGALGAQRRVFSLGLGGRLGSGRQWVSWISIDDEVAALVHALESEGLSGPVNLTAPNPVTNSEHAQALAGALHRPALMAVPGFAIKAVLGSQMADEMLLGGQRVLPDRLTASGYEFRHPTIQEAFAEMFARS